MLTEAEMLTWLKAKVATFPTHRAAAIAWGISEQWLCDILREKRDIGPKLLKQIGFRRVIRFRKVENNGTS